MRKNETVFRANKNWTFLVFILFKSPWEPKNWLLQLRLLLPSGRHTSPEKDYFKLEPCNFFILASVGSNLGPILNAGERSRAGGWGQMKTTTTELQLKKKTEVQQTSRDYNNNLLLPWSHSLHWSQQNKNSRDHKYEWSAMRNTFLPGKKPRLSAENWRGKSLDLCLHLVIKLLVVFMLPHLEQLI